MQPASGPDESTYLRQGEQLEVAGNPTAEKLRTLANGVLMAASFALGATMVGVKDGWSVLGTTLATSAVVFAWSRLNLHEQTRKILCFLVAGATYELFLTLYTIRGSNNTSQAAQYLPLLSLVLGGAIWLELSTRAVMNTRSQIKTPKAPEVGDVPPRFCPYPTTRQTIRYCALQALPAIGGSVLVALGQRSSGVSGFLMQSSGIRLLAASAGRVAQDLFANLILLPSLDKDQKEDVPYTAKSKRLIALNEGMQQMATLMAPVAYAVALTADKIHVACATGFLNGVLDAEAQRRLEIDALRPPGRLSENQKKIVNRVSYAVTGIFGALLLYYLLVTSIRTDDNPEINHPATWGATGGIIGTTLITFGFTKLIRRAWKNADERGAFVWLSRLFGAESTRWLAYLNADFVHARNIRGAIPSIGVVMTGLLLSAATVGLDLALLNDDRLVSMRLSAFAWAMLMRYAITVPGSFPLRAANATVPA